MKGWVDLTDRSQGSPVISIRADRIVMIEPATTGVGSWLHVDGVARGYDVVVGERPEDVMAAIARAEGESK